MEYSPKNKLNPDKNEVNNMKNNYVKLSYNYGKNEKILLKKRPNSVLINNNKNNNISIKYNFTNTTTNLIKLKIYKKSKSSILKTNNIKKNSIKSNINDKSINSNMIKNVGFRKNKYENSNRIMSLGDLDDKAKLKRKSKKFNSFDEIELLIPFKSKNEYKKDDFEVISLSGKGAYATVLQVKLKTDIEQENENKHKKEKFYAIKVIDISSLKKVNKLYQVYLESQILNELNSPFIVKIYGTFNTKKKMYMVMDYLSNGDFASFIKMNYPLKEETIRFYSAEIVLFLEYLQSQKIVHRDLKPQNIMLNDKYHLQIIDFATVRKIGYYYDKSEMKFRQDNYDLESGGEDIKGTKRIVNPDDDDDLDEEEELELEEEKEEEKEIEKENNNKNKININKKRKIKKIPPRNKTFVGTAEYVSPEVISDQKAGYGADLWAFGIMLYEMFCGKTPFKGITTYVTFKNIEKLNITYEENISISENAKDLIKKILVKEPEKRLGAGEPNTDFDIEHLKKHPFFKGIKWKNVINHNVPNSKTFKFKSKKTLNRKRANNNKEQIINNENSNIVILKKGYLLKKSFWFHYNERLFILDSTPKITYKEVDKDAIKGVIYLNKKCKVYASRQDIFNLETPKEVYKFKCKQNDMVLWINAIKDCIKTYGKDE